MPVVGLRRRAAGVVAVLVLLPLDVGTAGAVSLPVDKASTARCWSVGVTTITSGGGLTLLEANRVTAEARAVPHCVGTIRGHQVTGPGELASHEVMQGTCRGGQGISTFTLRVPTAGGVQEIRDVAPFTFTGTVGVGHGRMLAENVILVLAALEGDCVTEPVTKIEYLDTFRIYTGG